MPDRIDGKLVARVGAGLLLAGVALLFRHAVIEGWLTPTLRVAFGALLGTMLVGAGRRAASERPRSGRLLQGTGVAVLYLTAFAAHARYGLVDPVTGLVQLTGVSAVAVGLALAGGGPVLSAVGLAGAASAPVVIGGDAAVLTAGYQVAVLGLGAWLAVARRWWLPHLVAVVGASTSLLVEGLGGVDTTGGRVAIQVGLAALWAAGWAVPVLCARRSPDAQELTVPALIATPLVPVAVLATSMGLWPGVPRLVWTGVAVVMALPHVAAAEGLTRARGDARVLRELQALPAVVLLLVGAAPLDDAVLALVLAAVATGLVAAGHRADRPFLGRLGHVLWVPTGALWCVLLALAPPAEPADGRSLALAGVVVFAAATAALLRPGSHAVIYAVGSLTGWLALTGAELRPVDVGLVTAAWVATGLVLAVGGRLRGIPGVTWSGLGVLGVSLAKLVLVDLAAASPLIRIGLFLGTGLALLGLGWWLGDDVTAPQRAAEDQPLASRR